MAKYRIHRASNVWVVVNRFTGHAYLFGSFDECIACFFGRPETASPVTIKAAPIPEGDQFDAWGEENVVRPVVARLSPAA